MTLKLALAQALDRKLRSKGGKAIDLEDPEWFNKPLLGMDAGMVLLAYDTESVTNDNYKTTVLNRTTEHGFAWLRLADVVGVAPGSKGVNWHPHIQARHWVNRELKNYQNQDYCVGNPHGFWEQYGKSLFYTDKEGPAPFQALFKELAGNGGGGVPATALKSLALEPTAFPSLSRGIPTGDERVANRVPLLEKTNKVKNIDGKNECNKWARGNPWAGSPPTGGTQGVRADSVQNSADSGRVSLLNVPSTKASPINNASRASKGSASITASTAKTDKHTAANGKKTTTSSSAATTKVAMSWAEIARRT